MKKEIGRTKDVGFQFGIRKSFSLHANDLWDFIFSEKGIRIWLGDLDTSLSINQHFTTSNGIEGFIRIFKPFSHIRLKWKKKDWTNFSTVQVRIIPIAEKKSTVSFHQEHLLNSAQRLEMKNYWSAVLDHLVTEIKLMEK
jgi:hypothetical protein